MAKRPIRSNRELKRANQEKKPVATESVFGKRAKGTDGMASWSKKLKS